MITKFMNILLVLSLFFSTLTVYVNADEEEPESEEAQRELYSDSELTNIESEDATIDISMDDFSLTEEDINQSSVNEDMEEVINDKNIIGNEVLENNKDVLNSGEEAITFSLEANTRDSKTSYSMSSNSPANYLGSTEVLPEGTVIPINGKDDLILLSNVNAEVYQNCKLEFASVNEGYNTTGESTYNNTSYTFLGLGKDEYPFKGELSFIGGSENSIITLNRPLFNALSTDTKFITSNSDSPSVTLVNDDNNNTSLLAEKVTGSSTANWSVQILSSSNEKVSSNPPIFGVVDSDSSVLLSVIDKSEITQQEDKIKTEIKGTGNVGYLCGTLNGNLTLSSLNIEVTAGNNENDETKKAIKVTSIDGSAGGLVGNMGANASLTVSDGISLSLSTIAGEENAGGLVGGMGSNSSLTVNNAVLRFDTIRGKETAGGLVGLAESGSTIVAPDYNVVTINAEPENNESGKTGNAGGIVGRATDIIINNVPNITETTISGKIVGTLFGSYTYSGTNSSALNTISKDISDSKLKGSAYSGGIFGELKNTSKASSIMINSGSINVTFATGSSGTLGGLIGKYSVSKLDSSLILEARNVSSSISNEVSDYGGIIGYVGENPAYIEINNTIVKASKQEVGTFGGLIASMSDRGHMVKVSGVTIGEENNTFTGKNNAGGLIGSMPSGVLWLYGGISIIATPKGGKSSNRGWIVGHRDNTLVVNTDSTSVWNPNKGQYTNDIGSWGQVVQAHGALNDLLTFSDRTVTVKTLPNAISDVSDFGAFALRFQLQSQPNGALKILDNDFTANSSVSISLTSSIDLDGTGFTGLQRDYNNAELVNITSFTGGDNISIAFPNITIYPAEKSHNRQGLFSNVGEISVSNLELKGGTRTDKSKYGINLQANGSGTYAGALVAEASGNVTLTNVKSYVDICASGSLNKDGLSGFIASQKGGSVTYKNCEWDSDLIFKNGQPGFMGGFLARAENSISAITVNNCKIKGSISKTSGSNYGGGLFGSLYDKNNAQYEIVINGLDVDGVEINANGCDFTGGLLGWEWMNAKTTISDITIKNSTLNAGSKTFGGLIYKGSGYWKIKKGSKTGVLFDTNNNISGSTSAGETSGLILCHGDKLNDHNNALYLELLDDAYTINEAGVQLHLTGDGEYFDEIIGTTEGQLGNGILSVSTYDDRIFKVEGESLVRNTYESQLSQNYRNSNTRYYYNLDSFGAAGNIEVGRTLPTGNVQSPGDMVMYSAYTHCYNKLQNYFYNSPLRIGVEGKGDGYSTEPIFIDLTNYSYYPAEDFINVENAKITFGYEKIELKEKGNKKPSDSSRQHYGMHTGLFKEVEIGKDVNNPRTLIVKNLSLEGTVGGSAIFCGNIQGGNTNAKLELRINTVKLNGIRIYPTLNKSEGVFPLLIKSIGSYTELDMKCVEIQSSSYTDLNNDKYIASSLIGRVGNESGSHIQLTFSDMVLNNTNKELFSKALFLESFEYSGDCSGTYNFTNLENKRYTLGQELSNTERGGSEIGPSGRNNGFQYNFFGDNTTVCSVVGNGAENPDSFFNDYIRYVYHVEEGTFHELDINLTRSGLTKGCGTYNDPYIISTSKQLEDLAKVLNGNLEGMEINVDTNVLNGNTLNSFSGGHSKDTKNTHKKYICTASGWKDGEDITENVRLYLRNAYYKIDRNIDSNLELSGEWTGLGATADSAFCGVIDGSDKTISIKSASGSQFGGLIKFSLGSVIKDLTIDYGNKAISINCQGIPSTESNSSFFGGVVGWCIGGDTIIDNVKVANLKFPSISGTNTYLVAAGGYVGMVGGAIMSTTNNILKYGGGVVFRSKNLSELRVDNTYNNYFYVNPYVGRVLDGYVISEDKYLENTDNNYKIPYFKPDDSYLTFNQTNSKFLVNNAEGLWLLSAIANSGAGAIQDNNCDAYTKGKARTGSYNNIGNSLGGNDLNDENYLGGLVNKQKTKTYLTSWDESATFYNICKKTIAIEFSKAKNFFDMSVFGNGFRGIGTSYGTNVNSDSNYRLLKITGIEGNNKKITLSQNRNEYTEEKDTWTSIGSGLFVLLQPDATSFVASNLILTGNTGITYSGTSLNTDNLMNSSSKPKPIGSLESNERLSYVGVGLFAGNIAKTSTTISKIEFKNIDINGTNNATVKVNDSGIASTHAGGLIGLLWNNGTIGKVLLKDCEINNINVRGRMNSGGYVGYLKSSESSISFTNDKTLRNIETLSTQKTVRDDNGVGVCGVGGLIGYNNSPLTINATKVSQETAISQLTIENLTITNSLDADNPDKTNTGGLVGLWVQPSGTAKINNIKMVGDIKITGGGSDNPNTSTGGLVGAIVTATWGGWSDSKNCGMEIMNIHISAEPDSSRNNSRMIIKNGRQTGGLFGMTMLKNSVIIDDVTIGGTNHPVTIANTKGLINQAVSAVIAAAIDAQNTTISNVKIINTNLIVDADGDRGAGLVTGYVEKDKSKIKLNNILLNDCAVVTNTDGLRTGLIYGKLKDGPSVYGTNILIKNCIAGLMLTKKNSLYTSSDFSEFNPTMDNTGIKLSDYVTFKDIKDISGSSDDLEKYSTNSRKGIIGGDSGSSTVQLVGLSIQQTDNTLPMKYYGTDPNSSSYIVRADYTGVANGDASLVTSRPNSNLGNLSAYSDDDSVTINITGDGSSFNAENQAIGIEILEDLGINKRLNLKHSEVSEAKQHLDDTKNIWSFSDFNTAGGNDFKLLDDKNFPVLVLTTTSSREINNIVYSWLSMFTNRKLYSTDDGCLNVTDGFKLSATPYFWDVNSKSFRILASDYTLSVSDNNIIALEGYRYDNQKGQFTLLDATFDNPTDNGKTYHLYIPVIVQKVLNYRFWAATQTGTTYHADGYDHLDALSIASNGEKITALIGYEYERDTNEWQKAVNNGDKLLGNFKKQIEIDSQLPDDTMLTLVDRTNLNKAYSALYKDAKNTSTTGKTSISFSSFKDSDDNAWSPVNLCDMLTLNAKIDNENGQYVKIDMNQNEFEPTIRIKDIETGDYNYYRFVPENDRTEIAEELWTIKVGEVKKSISEQYYLTIQTPLENTGFYNNLITCPDRLIDKDFSQPTQRKDANAEKKLAYTRNGNENRFVFGDCFKQTVTITNESGNEISSANRSIKAILTTLISFKGDDEKKLYSAYIKDQNLYECFELKFKDNDGYQKNLVGGIVITVQFSLNDEDKGTYNYEVDEQTGLFRLKYPLGIGNDIIGSLKDGDEIKLVANISLDFTDTAIINQFPVRDNNQSEDGIKLFVTSKLAYKEENIAYSTLSQNVEGSKLFYRKDFKTANLNYNPINNNDSDENFNQLGINGIYDNSFVIKTKASYNVSAIEEATNASKLRYKLTLWKRNNSSESEVTYEKITGYWSGYLKGGFETGLISVPIYTRVDNQISIEAQDVEKSSNADTGEYIVVANLLGGLKKDVPLQIPVDLTVLTGEPFEQAKYTYANYKVRLEAELLDNSGHVINGTNVSDYIIYTNAKINPNPILK